MNDFNVIKIKLNPPLYHVVVVGQRYCSCLECKETGCSFPDCHDIRYSGNDEEKADSICYTLNKEYRLARRIKKRLGLPASIPLDQVIQETRGSYTAAVCSLGLAFEDLFLEIKKVLRL